MTIDLDSAPDLLCAHVVEATHLVHALLDELGLGSFLKTTANGLHLVVPLERRPVWDEVKAFSCGIAEHLARVLPYRFTAQ